MSQFYSLHILLILVIYSLFMPSSSIENENCTIKLISKTNPITGKVTFAGRQNFEFSTEDASKSVELLIVRQNKELTLRFKSDHKICLPKSAEISMLTQDKKILPLKSNSRDNCSGTMIFNFGGMFGKEKARDILYDRGILSISFEDIDQNGYFMTLHSNQQTELKQVLQCLVNI